MVSEERDDFIEAVRNDPTYPCRKCESCQTCEPLKWTTVCEELDKWLKKTGWFEWAK